MNQVKTISKQIVAILLICIFTCSITPVTVFHDVVSNHVDENIEHNHKHQSEFAKAGVNCHMQGFVAERNYCSSITAFSMKASLALHFFKMYALPCFYSQHHFFAELRGPPAQA